MEKKPVLIVGAGPTGLTLANFLALTHTPFRLIDRAGQPSRASKAFGIHARTLEIFDQIGIAGKAIKAGSIDNTVHILIKDKEAARISLKELLPGETAFPYLLILQQAKTENLLAEALEKKGHRVYWQHELTEVTETNGLVRAGIKGKHTAEIGQQFSYVVGCDGAGSAVRERSGFTFKGETLCQTFYLADAELTWEHPHSDIYFMLAPHHITAVFSFPEKNQYRIFNFLNRAVTKAKDAPLSLPEVQQILDDNPYVKARASEMDWSSVFRIHTRYTGAFRKGRIFLAGDAAHVHSPAAGQGMNTGIQDAYNLAWKLGLVYHNKAGPHLLDTYEEERQPIARNLHRTTDRFFRLMVTNNWLVNFLRLHVFPKVFMAALGFSWLRKKNLRRFSQLSIKYRFSSLSRESNARGFRKNAPKPGDRAPYCKLAGEGSRTDVFQLFEYPCFTLLVAGSDKAAQPLAAIKAFCQGQATLPINLFCFTRETGKAFFEAYGVKQEAVFLIRPDGHIGFRSSRISLPEIKQSLQQYRQP